MPLFRGLIHGQEIGGWYPERNPDPELSVEFSGSEFLTFSLIFLFVNDNKRTYR